jgi:cell division septation protein DedD
MSDDRKPESTGSDDPWARFEELDREAGVRRSDLDPLEEEPADDDWLDDDDFLEDDEESSGDDDEELFDDEVAPASGRTAADSDTSLDSPATASLRASRDDYEDDYEETVPAGAAAAIDAVRAEATERGDDDFDPYDDEDEEASGDDDYDDEYEDDESDPPLPAADTYRASSDALQPRNSAAIAAGAATAAMTRPTSPLTATMSDDDLDDDEPRYTDHRRDVPWLLLGAGALALVLVLAGGYGVMQQRNDLQSEIRELRARLATTPNTDSIAAAREEQAQLRAQNTELATAYQALQEETARLQGALEALKAAPPAARASTPAPAPTSRQASAAPSSPAPAASRSPATTPTATPATTAAVGGDWFVNFAAYGNEATARSWANRLKVSGGKVEVQPIQSNGQRLYRVRVSNIASRAEATRIARTLEQEHKVKPWVGQD